MRPARYGRESGAHVDEGFVGGDEVEQEAGGVVDEVGSGGCGLVGGFWGAGGKKEVREGGSWAGGGGT